VELWVSSVMLLCWQFFNLNVFMLIFLGAIGMHVCIIRIYHLVYHVFSCPATVRQQHMQTMY
jgi:hypothetical protein